MKKKRKKLGRKLLSFLLTLAMVMGLVPGMSLTALAWEGDTYASLLNTTTVVKFDNKDWYLIENNSMAANAGTVTLLSKECVVASEYDSNGSSNTYSGSTVETAVNTYYNGSISSNVKSAVVDNKMFLLTKEQADAMTADTRKCSRFSETVNSWWLCSPGSYHEVKNAAAVNSDTGNVAGGGWNVGQVLGVRPALKLDLSKVAFDSTTKIFSLPTSYPLWVGGTQVTSENASNIDGDNKASYDDSTHTLTLNGYNLTVSNGDPEIEYGIKYTGSDPLTINLEGQNTIEGYWRYNRYFGIDYGIYITRESDIAADVTFTGEGSLSIKTYNNGITAFTNTHTNESVGNIVFSGSGEIEVVASRGDAAVNTNYGTVTVNSGTVTANGRNGIDTQKGVSITGGTVNAIGTTDDDSGIGIDTMDELSITGGTVNVSGEENGISAGWYGKNDTITIDENVISVTISSSGKAISGKLLNKLSGKGWTNVAGTEGETTIEAVNVAQVVAETLKKIYFSSHEHNFMYTANGATITATCSGDDCKLTNRQATLTIAAAGGTYDGTTAFSATVTNNIPAVEGDTVGSIEYYKVNTEGATTGGTVQSSVPVNAGYYYANVTLTSGSNSYTAVKAFTIAKGTAEALDENTARTNSGINYQTEQATPSSGYQISTDNANPVASTPVRLTDILDGNTPTLYVRRTENDNQNAGDWVSVTLTARPSAPTGLTTEEATNGSTANGKISGVNTTMEYSADGTSWTDVNGGTTIEGLTPGTYQVRVKATANVPHGRATEVTVGSKQIILTDSQKPTAKTGLTYNGKEQALINAPTVALPEGAIGMRYAIGTDATTAPTDGWNESIPTATDAGTYYVWYKVVGDDAHSDSEPKCIIVTIRAEGSGGGGAYVPSTPTPTTPTTPAESYTVPVSNENTVNISTNISAGNAVVNEITQSDIEKIVNSENAASTSENKSITIDVSKPKSEVTSVQLTESTMEKLTEAVKADNHVDSVEIKMTNATVELDGKALDAVANQAEGNNIKLVVENTQTTKLNTAQQEALNQFTFAKSFQAYFESNGKEIHDFKGGKATVSIKFTPEAGRDAKYYHMYYLPLAGAIERYATRYIDGMLSFVTTHFSDYAIVYDETRANETGKAEEPETGTDDGKPTEEVTGATANGKTTYQNALSINKGLKVSQTGSKIAVSWGAVSGADRYEVYATYCGTNFGKTPLKIVTKKGVTSIKITRLNGKKLELKKNFKFYVVAYKTVSGKKQKLGRTVTAHIVGRKNTKYTNVKGIKLTKTAATMKVGKTYKIKATVVLVDPSKKMLPATHAATFRYASSNKKIATVDKNGKVTAKKAGTCYIWVYAKNGYAKKVKITVK